MTQCRSCFEQIVFLKTNTGKIMPVNYTKDIKPDDFFDSKKHKSHFLNCPNAKNFRRK